MLPEGKCVDVGAGLKIHYHEAGPPDGPTAIFIHGSGPGASGFGNFKGNFPVLAEHGIRVLVPDLPGYGFSSKPDDVEYALEFIAQAIGGFARALGVEHTALIGNSLGGAVAIRVALDHPSLVQKLVLMAPGGLEERAVYMEMPGIKTMLSAFFAPEGITHEGLRKTFRLQLFDPKGITDELIAERHQIAVTQPKQVLSTMKVKNQAPELGKLACPVLGFWGADDQFCPVGGALTLAKGCRRAKVIVLSECGHWVMVEHRDTFNRACLEFLSAKEKAE
jgi:4,5:9,10-diseco-3-hydroxy-5,9,17-trioxoandrosta-1(10),2-diene-4-oate hydrolase